MSHLKSLSRIYKIPFFYGRKNIFRKRQKIQNFDHFKRKIYFIELDTGQVCTCQISKKKMLVWITWAWLIPSRVCSNDVILQNDLDYFGIYISKWLQKHVWRDILGFYFWNNFLWPISELHLAKYDLRTHAVPYPETQLISLTWALRGPSNRLEGSEKRCVYARSFHDKTPRAWRSTVSAFGEYCW